VSVIEEQKDVWEYCLYHKDSERRIFDETLIWDDCPECVAKTVAESECDGIPETTSVWVWKNGEYQGAYVVEPDIDVTWRAFRCKEPKEEQQ